MKKKGIHLLATAMTLVLVMTAATPVTAEAASPRPTVSGSSKITKGKRVQFSVKYKKKRVSAKSCKWYSTKKSVATVSRGGKVTVKNPAPKISKSKVTLTKGKSITLKVTGTKKKPKWSSSKKSVAVVSRNGRVTAKKAGTAKITAKIGKKKYTCKVIVKNPAKPAVKPKPPVSKPDDCIQESAHNWVEQPGGIGEYHETIVKEATTYCVCRRCGFINEGSMPSHHSSWTVTKVGPEIYTWDQDLSIPYKCSKCGKTKTEEWTEKGKETLRVYTVSEIEMAHREPEACVWAVCPYCKSDWHPDAWEKWNGVCINCNRAFPEWRENLLHAWDYGDVYRDWDESGREMTYNPDSKIWEYTGR